MKGLAIRKCLKYNYNLRNGIHQIELKDLKNAIELSSNLKYFKRVNIPK